MIWSIGTTPVTNGFSADALAVQAALEGRDVLLHAVGEPHHFLAARRQRVARAVALEQPRAEPMLDLSEFSKHG